MRKQTKLVAVASAAALLAIGASMTSFAATGWIEEDGAWYYYDKDGNRVEDAWKKSGDNWYWLDSEEGGAMAVDKLIEDDDDTYYVDANGVMVKNTWVKVVNEEQDDEDDPAEYNYYYMQSNGKAYKAGTSSSTRFKTIDGKRYAFDDNGKMLYGWVDENATRGTGESDWESATYYLGDWNDGAMKTGWQKITVYDDAEDDDMDYWFNFKSNGKKRFLDKNDIGYNGHSQLFEKKLNGKTYGFDERGVMTYEWTEISSTSVATQTSAWKYFANPEDGARKTKGWFKVVAPNEDNTFKDYGYDTFAKTDADDETERWYYAGDKGVLTVGKIEKIKGKYYGFRPENTKSSGAMLTGLCLLKVDPTNGNIDAVAEANMDSDYLDEIIDGDHDALLNSGYSLYYFGNNADEDGALKTGFVNVNLDGENYSMYFSKTGGAEGKGRGVTGIDDNRYIYKAGVKLKADNDEKYIVVHADGDIAASGVTVAKVDSSALRAAATSAGTNKDNESVKYHSTLGADYYLINTSGAIIKNKTAAKDGDDWYFYVDNKEVKMYTNNKVLKDTSIENWK